MWLVVLLGLAILFIVVATARWGIHPFLALLIAAFGFGMASGMPLADVVKSVNGGFGGTIGYIGIVILAGSIIGTFLEKSGGALRLAESTLRATAASGRVVERRAIKLRSRSRVSISCCTSRKWLTLLWVERLRLSVLRNWVQASSCRSASSSIRSSSLLLTWR